MIVKAISLYNNLEEFMWRHTVYTITIIFNFFKYLYNVLYNTYIYNF